jgi:hypothetical protein
VLVSTDTDTPTDAVGVTKLAKTYADGDADGPVGPVAPISPLLPATPVFPTKTIFFPLDMVDPTTVELTHNNVTLWLSWLDIVKYPAVSRYTLTPSTAKLDDNTDTATDNPTDGTTNDDAVYPISDSPCGPCGPWAPVDVMSTQFESPVPPIKR